MMSVLRISLLVICFTLWFSLAVRADTVSFAGLIQNSPGSGVIPPDTMGAVGPNVFFETLNSAFQSYSLTGTPIGGSISGAQFWANAGISSTVVNGGNGPSDPRVIY